MCFIASPGHVHILWLTGETNKFRMRHSRLSVSLLLSHQPIILKLKIRGATLPSKCLDIIHKTLTVHATHVLGALRSTLPRARPDDTCVVIRIRGSWSLMMFFVSNETIGTFGAPFFTQPTRLESHSNARVVTVRPPICGKNTRN